jgi:hypothetical protein
MIDKLRHYTKKTLWNWFTMHWSIHTLRTEI